MKSGEEAQRAHDQLLALRPAGVEHEPCDLCPQHSTKEVAKVADDRTYTEAEHIALMAAEVTRETATLSEAKTGLETTVSELAGKVDVLEAEKTTLDAAKAEVQKAFDDYKADIERLAEVAELKTKRVEAIKAANGALPDTYFTDERAQKWAEMAEEAFAVVLDGIAALAGETASTKETATFAGGDSPSSSKATPASVAKVLRTRSGRGEN